jgi:hypothetical protein
VALQALIDRHGTGAVLTNNPYVLDSGETLRWIVLNDGEEVHDVDVRVDEKEGVMFLTHAGEELELSRWSTERYLHGPQIVETLGGLQRRSAEG